MTKVHLNKKYYDVPEKWDELTRDQLLQVMDILFLKGYKDEQILLRLVQMLTRMSDYQFFKCKAEELEEFLYLSTFLLLEDFNFTKQLIEKYHYSHSIFYGPADGLANFRMQEFALTEELFPRWFDSKEKLRNAEGDVELLNELVAILYRPAISNYDFDKDPNGDKRERFNQNTSSYYATTYVKLWPLNVKLAIATWYAGCRLNIIRCNPDVFEGSGDEPSRYGLVSVMLGVAETHVFGDFEKVEEQYVNLVMMQLNETVDKANRIKREMKA